MGLKVRLDWYDKKTDLGEGQEYSEDLGDDASIFGALGLPVENNVNNGGFDVGRAWVSVLQHHFAHVIDLAAYDYQVSFDYRDQW
ncbi:colicin E3-like toxin immunity protein [Pseudomonas chlororaphis]|uniref:colicin E3-like toxin immunity protein n=1 Tax=Pseudomonas chlororaphis TaxID=587753 RepID=UPI000BE3CE01|nr:colicin E3-like toxin immunity protein [Pseudomonas chlororaphis]